MRRGLSDPSQARLFLDPDFAPPTPPEELPGVTEAVLLLLDALASSRRILVWGDYDVDGQTATAALVETLTALGAAVTYRLPLRRTEGYGIRPEALAALLDASAPPQVLITCDVGATAFTALDLARARGLTIIVTDHHTLARSPDGADRLPAADAFVTPRLLVDQEHPLAALPGVGAAYKLIEALANAAGRSDLAENVLDLAALGIVADMAEISGETRRLLQWGLRRLRRNLRPGLAAIYERAGLEPSTLTEMHIGFEIAPRLNALGRLADANPGVELLTTHDPARARLLAVQIEGLNARRRLLTAEVYRSARRQIERDPALQRAALLTIYHPDWEPGVIGIAAARIAERYGRPALLAAAPAGGVARGSARSIPGFNITAALAAQSHLLTGFGGHAYAAGFSLASEDLPRLRLELEKAAALSLPTGGTSAGDDGQAASDERFESALPLDWSAISPELAAEVERLAPFGPGSPAPAFRTGGLRLTNASARGRERLHLALTLENADGLSRRVTWWGGAELVEDAADAFPHQAFELLYSLRAATSPGRTGRRTSLEGVELEYLAHRLTVEPAPEKPRLIVADCRDNMDHPLPGLLTWLECQPAADEQPRTLIYAEGPARDRLAAALAARSVQAPVVDRRGLVPCEVLVLWTAPPSPAALRDLLGKALGGLEREIPLQVGVFNLDPGLDATRPFLERLIGLARWTINTRGGETEPERLAAALAASPAAVRAGLEALAERSILLFETADNGMLRLEWLPSAVPRPYGAAAARLRSLLDESRAFRRYLARLKPLDLERFLAK